MHALHAMTTTATMTNGRTKRADRTLSHGTPANKVLGLPLARWIPQDVHSMMDYTNAASVGSGWLVAADDDPAARWASIALAAAGAGVSLATDYRLSLVKEIPIEVHEGIDYAWGMAAIAAPFVLGYWKSSPRVALTHVMTGAATILTALFTDYRAFRRRGHSQRAAR